MTRKGINTRTLDLFNQGQQLDVVRVDDTRLGVVKAGTRTVWIETEIAPTVLPHKHLPRVALSALPVHYGQWKSTSVGGVGKTERLEGVLRVAKSETPVVLFATRGTDEFVIKEALAGCEEATVGDTEWTQTDGWVTEVVVHEANRVAVVAARIARTGATVMLENEELNACRSIGIERLDRIGAKVVHTSTMVDAAEHGLRRGVDNWFFPWMPASWCEPPITWDHMVRNVGDAPLACLPLPLRQHVARARLDAGEYEPLGSRWARTTAPRDDELEWANAWGDDCVPSADGRLRPVMLRVPESKQEAVASGGLVDVQALGVVLPRTIARVGAEWYRVVDKRAALAAETFDDGARVRYVSARLTRVQSRQLITAFYIVCVEESVDAEQRHAASVVLFHYMKERGYTARWMGKYEQRALHVGNGDSFRRFRRMRQYAPHRLPADVLNKLCDVRGKLRNRGSKGSRSKYKGKTVKYTPHNPLRRSRDAEQAMMRG